MERLLLQHEKEVAEFISLVESVNLNVAPDLSSVITYGNTLFRLLLKSLP